MELVSDETKNLFKIRLENTFALNEEHKKIILQDLDKLSLQDIYNILNVIDNYEYLITKDSLNQEEQEERENLDGELNNLMNSFNF